MAFGAAFLYLIALVALQGWNSLRFFSSALAGAAATLSKANGIIFSLCFLAILAAYQLYQRKIKSIFSTIGLAVIVTLLHFLFVWIAGDLKLNGETHPVTLLKCLKIISTPFSMFKSYFGCFCWYEISFSNWVYAFYYSLIIFITFNLFFSMRRSKQEERLNPNHLVNLVLFLGSCLFILSMYSAQFFLMKKVGFILQGRYFLPTLLVLYLWIGVYFEKLSSSHNKLKKMNLVTIQKTILIFLIILSNYALLLVIKRHYMSPGDKLRFLFNSSYMEMILNRMMQYKPEYLKSDFVFTIVWTSYILSQIGMCIIISLFDRNFLKIQLKSLPGTYLTSNWTFSPGILA